MQEKKNDTLVSAKVTSIGFADPEGKQGVLVLTSEDGKNLPMTAFTGEVAYHIGMFMKGDRTSVPTVYKLVEDLAERLLAHLVGIEVYRKGTVLRANLKFRRRDDDIILTNYRASDSIALAVYYDVPIRVQKELFEVPK